VGQQPVQVIKVSRDEQGIKYDDPSAAPAQQAEAPTAKPEAPAPEPVKIRSRKAAEEFGFTITAEREESLREIGDGLYAKQEALLAGEWCGSFRDQPPSTYHFQASSLKGLLHQFEDWENRRRENQ
jgi:hypothetical protein